MNSDLDCSYREQQKQMMKEMYYPSYTKKLSFDEVVYKFEDAIRTRITHPYDDHNIQVKKYRDIPHIKEAYGILKSFRPSNKYEKHSITFLKEIITDEMYYWELDDWSHSKKNGEYVFGKGFDYLDMFIQKYLLQTAKNLQIKNKKSLDNQTHSNDIKTSKTTIIEPKNKELEEETTPVKIKKEKPVFLPTHKLVVKDGLVDWNSVIYAIADLVWREPNKRDLYYIGKLDLSNLTEQQIKYVKSLFYMNDGRKNASNHLFSIEKRGKVNILYPARKREGYYYIDNKTGEAGLVSLTTVSNKLGLLKMTTKKRLDKMSLQDLVKMEKEK